MGEGVAMRHTCNRRVEDAEEVGPPRGGPPGWRGVGPLSPSIALRLQTARGKSALVASVAPGRCGCDRVRLMHDRAGSGRKGAGSRAQVGRGMAGWDGLGSAPQKLDLQMLNQFQSVDQPQPAAASGLPLVVVERKSLGGAWGNALSWLIIDLAREHSNTRISRQQGGHCR